MSVSGAMLVQTWLAEQVSPAQHSEPPGQERPLPAQETVSGQEVEFDCGVASLSVAETEIEVVPTEVGVPEIEAPELVRPEGRPVMV